MIDQDLLLWVIGGVVIALLLLILIWVRLSRRHVELPRTSLDDGPAKPTLARDRPVTEPVAPARPVAIASDLARLKGVGPKLVARLAELGVTRTDQVAAWSTTDIAAIDGALGGFAGRIERDKWVEQARLLSSNDVTAYEAAFGKIDPTRA